MSDVLEIVFWDVQHGHCTYLKTPNGKHILIDLGIGSCAENDQKFSPILHLIKKWKVSQLDFVGITHPHLDHFDDILNFEKLNPTMFFRPVNVPNQVLMKNVRKDDIPKFQKYCDLNDKYDQLRKGSTNFSIKNTEFWGGVRINVFYPYSEDMVNLNQHSLVFIVEYLQTKIVITGDNTKSSLDYLMKKTEFKQLVENASILLAPHHGRESGYNKDFVSLVNPLLTIVSDGINCDTSANKRYSQNSRGYDVFSKKKNEKSKRYCLTTNSDGVILAKISPSKLKNSKGILDVSI